MWFQQQEEKLLLKQVVSTENIQAKTVLCKIRKQIPQYRVNPISHHLSTAVAMQTYS
jgi:hypothetical protein